MIAHAVLFLWPLSYHNCHYFIIAVYYFFNGTGYVAVLMVTFFYLLILFSSKYFLELIYVSAFVLDLFIFHSS